MIASKQGRKVNNTTDKVNSLFKYYISNKLTIKDQKVILWLVYFYHIRK
jgi:hypothetical protein